MLVSFLPLTNADLNVIDPIVMRNKRCNVFLLLSELLLYATIWFLYQEHSAIWSVEPNALRKTLT